MNCVMKNNGTVKVTGKGSIHVVPDDLSMNDTVEVEWELVSGSY